MERKGQSGVISTVLLILIVIAAVAVVAVVVMNTVKKGGEDITGAVNCLDVDLEITQAQTDVDAPAAADTILVRVNKGASSLKSIKAVVTSGTTTVASKEITTPTVTFSDLEVESLLLIGISPGVGDLASGNKVAVTATLTDGTNCGVKAEKTVA